MHVRRLGLSLAALSIALAGIIGPTSSPSAYASGGAGGIKDAQLAKCINNELHSANMPDLSGDSATPEQVASVQKLSCTNSDISDLSGLEKFTNLRNLDLSRNKFNNINQISHLKLLDTLNINNNKNVSDISPVKSLTSLHSIDFDYDSVAAIDALSELKDLHTIYAQENRILNISAVKNLKNLVNIDFRDNGISDISALAGLAELKYVYLDDNAISDVSPFPHLAHAEEITLRYNHIHDFSPLAKLSGRIRAEDQVIYDKKPIAGVPFNPEVTYLDGKSMLGSTHIDKFDDGTTIDPKAGTITFPSEGLYSIKLTGECNEKICVSAFITFTVQGAKDSSRSKNISKPETSPEKSHNKPQTFGWFILPVANGGQGISLPLLTDKDGKASLKNLSFTRPGWVFDGWNTKADGSGTRYAIDATVGPIAKSMFLYAQWKPDTRKLFKLIYEANGPKEHIKNVPGTELMVPDEKHQISRNRPTRDDNHEFLGWNTHADGSGRWYQDSTWYYPINIARQSITGDITLYAQWGKPTTITYNGNGGDVTIPWQKVISGHTDRIWPLKPTRLGYEFKGWNTKQDGSGQLYDNSNNGLFDETPITVTEPTTVYAQWKKANILTYDANGGTNPPSQETIVQGKDHTVLADTPTRSGFKFVGWNSKKDGSGNTYSYGSWWWPWSGSSISGDDIKGDMTVYAQWEDLHAKTYTLTYDANGGGNAPRSEQLVADESHAITKNVPTRDGYNFVSWNTNKDGSGTTYKPASWCIGGSSWCIGGDKILSDKITKDITLYAQWAKRPTITFDANNGSDTATPMQVDASGHAVLPANTAHRTGYTAHGWNTAADGSGTSYSDGSKIDATSDITIYPQWTANNYMLSYDAHGGSITPGNEKIVAGKDHKISADVPAMDKAKFIGWNTKADGSGKLYQPGDTISGNDTVSNITLHARWDWGKNFTLHYNANGGVGGKTSETLNRNQAHTVTSDIPTRPGYTFNGWDTRPDGEGDTYNIASWFFTRNDSIPAERVKDDITLYARWKKTPPAEYVLTYDLNGGVGNKPANGHMTKGQDYHISLAVPTRPGFMFRGWNTKKDGSGQAHFLTDLMPGGDVIPGVDVTGDLVVYAQWEANYTVTFDPAGGTGEQAAVQADSDARIIAPQPSLTRPGYKFVGWQAIDNSVRGPVRHPGEKFKIDRSKVMHAVWSPDSHKER